MSCAASIASQPTFDAGWVESTPDRAQTASGGDTSRTCMITDLDRHTIGRIIATTGVDAWGVAANVPALPNAPALPFALSMLMRIDPPVVRGITHGPTPEYVRAYHRLNAALDEAAGTLADSLARRGYAAVAAPATSSSAHSGDLSLFSHKSAATSAGMGWIGKTALFVSPEFGPAVRLATVFTDLDLPAGEPVREGRCGRCTACVEACPAGCGRDVRWQAGMPRDQLFDAAACERHMAAYPDADICGICIAACPYSLRD
jgi:epoxyqueuosine reductase QueG